MGFSRSFWLPLVVCCTSVDSPRPIIDEQPVIWTEQPIAAVTVGIDNAGKPVGREFRLAAIGAASVPRAKLECIEAAARDVSVQLQQSLKALAEQLPAATSGGEVDTSAGVAALDASTDAAVDASVAAFAARAKTCEANVTAAIVQRHCIVGSPCGGDQVLFADDALAVTFTVLERWGDLRNEARDRERALPPNVVVLLPFVTNEAATSIVVPVRENAALPSRVPVSWPAVAPEDVAQRQFENLVAFARVRGRKIERNVARLADVPAEVAVRVVDALDVPTETLLDLRNVPDAKLQRISDEIARTRISECFRFRGLVTPDSIASCSGYKVGDLELSDCLAGRRCVPAFDATVWASVVAMSLERGPLAEASELPRLPDILQQSVDAVLAPIGECAKQPNEAAAASCLLDRQLGKDARRMRECFSSGKASVDKLACAIPLSPDARRVVECATKHRDDRDSQALCIAGATLPPEAVALLRCRREHIDDVMVAACMATTTIKGGTAEKVVMCIKKHPDDHAAAAICVAGDELPPDVAYAVECAQSSNDAMGAAACLGAKALPETMRKPVQCLAESGGDPLGTGLCMAADAKGLTAEQRIVLQCLVSTGGEPTAMATCTSGRLLAKEMMQCVGKKVFEGNCVGKNNAFRKLIEGVTGQELGPNSMVADYLNFQMDIVEAQVAVAKAAIKGAESLSKNIIREHKRAVRNVEREVGRGGKNVEREVGRGAKNVEREIAGAGKKLERVGKDVEREAGNFIKKVTPKIRVRVPKKVKVRIKVKVKKWKGIKL